MKPFASGVRSLGLHTHARSRNSKGGWGGTWHIDEVFFTIQSQRHYLYQAADQDRDTIDILMRVTVPVMHSIRTDVIVRNRKFTLRLLSTPILREKAPMAVTIWLAISMSGAIVVMMTKETP